jgi:hypothetical protein
LRFKNLKYNEYTTVDTIPAHGKAMLTMRAVLYRGASWAKKMLEATSPIEFKHASKTPVVKARAFKSGMLATVQAEKITDIGYA